MHTSMGSFILYAKLHPEFLMQDGISTKKIKSSLNIDLYKSIMLHMRIQCGMRLR